MKIYLDHDMISGIGKGDLPPSEMNALLVIIDHFNAGILELTTSTLALRELQPYKGQKRPDIEKVYDVLEKVPFVEDHKLLGFNNYFDRYTSISSPLIEDNSTSTTLRDMGLKRTDAHHLMLAINAGCQRFLTCDGGILSRGIQIEKRFQIIPMKPADFLTEFHSASGLLSP